MDPAAPAATPPLTPSPFPAFRRQLDETTGVLQARNDQVGHLCDAQARERVRAPHAAIGLSTAARSALTAVCKPLSREVARDGVTINNYCPSASTPEMAATIAAGRLGRPEELGAARAWLCSAHAGYVSGQNLSPDGGRTPASGEAAPRRPPPGRGRDRGYLPFLIGPAGAGAFAMAAACFCFFSAVSCFFCRSFDFGDLSPMGHRLPLR